MAIVEPAVFIRFNLGGKRIYAPLSAYAGYFTADNNGFTRLAVPLPGMGQTSKDEREAVKIEVNLHCREVMLLHEAGLELPTKVIAFYEPDLPQSGIAEMRLGQSLLAISRRPHPVQSADEVNMVYK